MTMASGSRQDDTASRPHLGLAVLRLRGFNGSVSRLNHPPAIMCFAPIKARHRY